MRTIAFAVLVTIVLSVYAAPASASDISISFQNEQFHAQMNLSVHQNMTQFPKEKVTLDASSNSDVSSSFNEALRKSVPSASISTLSLGLVSNVTWLNLTLSMTVEGLSERRGDVSALNTTWRSFNISRDLRAGNLSYNTLGERYFLPVVNFYVNASKFEDRPNATIKAVTFYINQTQSVAGPQAADNVGNFTVLDFRPLSVPLQNWQRTYNFTEHTTTWNYTPPVQLATSVSSTQLNKSLTLFSHYAYSAEIVVPGLAHASGDLVRVDVGSGENEWIMTGIVVLSLILVVVAQVLYRARSRALRLKRR